MASLNTEKALPKPPDLDEEEKWSSRGARPGATRLQPRLPALSDTPSTIPMSRRPVGGKAHVKGLSIASVSSVYSDTPGISQRFSEESRDWKNSLNFAELEDLKNIPFHQSLNDEVIHPLQGAEKRSHPSSVSSTPSGSSQPEIWKRRSPKTSISIPDLKLTKSNGLTNQPQAVERQIPPIPAHFRHKSVSFIEQLARSPVAAHTSPTQLGSMGVQTSRLSKLKNKVLRAGKEEDSDLKSSKSETHSDSVFSPISRSLTPDYQNGDPQPQISYQVLSPASPATPPHLPPIQSNFEEQNSIHRRAASTPNLIFSRKFEEPSDTLTGIVEPFRSPRLHKPAVSQILTPQASPPTSPQRKILLRTPTITRLFHQRSPVEPGTIFPAPELTLIQLDCYQGHRAMRRSNNDIYSLSCGICEQRDNEKRWLCIWCCLRCCDKCMEALSSTATNDLRLCLHKIGRSDRILQIEGKEHLHATLNRDN